VVALASLAGTALALPGLGDHQVQRWLVRDGDRARQAALQRQIAGILAHPMLTWHFDPEGSANVAVDSRSLSGLGWAPWLLGGLTLTLLLVAGVLLLTHPGVPARLFGSSGPGPEPELAAGGGRTAAWAGRTGLGGEFQPAPGVGRGCGHRCGAGAPGRALPSTPAPGLAGGDASHGCWPWACGPP